MSPDRRAQSLSKSSFNGHSAQAGFFGVQMVEPRSIKMDNGPPSEIYFAENLGSYVLTGAQSSEFNYQRAGATDSSPATRARTA